MTPTEQARRSDSLYYGEITRRELCNLVAHMEADIEEERRAYDNLKNVAMNVMRNGSGSDGKLPPFCPRFDSVRTDNGCLHCVSSLKVGDFWACVYTRGDDKNAMEGR